MKSEYILAIIAILPGLLAPMIAWLLSQRGVSRRAKEFESLLTRMELVEKLRQVKEQTSDSKTRLVENLDKEVGDILDDLESIRETHAPLTATPPHEVGKWGKYLLLKKQVSLKGKIYKALFYVSFFVAAFGGVGVVVEGAGEDLIFGLIGVGVYMAVGLGFRAAAERDYERVMKKAEAIGTRS